MGENIVHVLYHIHHQRNVTVHKTTFTETGYSMHEWTLVPFLVIQTMVYASVKFYKKIKFSLIYIAL